MRIQPERIMCAIDFSSFTDTTLAYGTALCREFHAKLFLVNVTFDTKSILRNAETSVDPEELQQMQTRNSENYLKKLTESLAIDHECLISHGDPAEEISRLAVEKKADMVITATHGKSGIKRFLIGSVTEKLMKIIHCPLLVLNTRKQELTSPVPFRGKLKKILVGCDFSPDSRLAFEYGLSLAQEFQSELYLTHVVKPTEHIELKASDYIDVKPTDYVHWRSPDYFEMQKKVTEKRTEKNSKLRSQLEQQLYFMVPEECRNWCIPKTALLNGEPYKELIKHAKEKNIDMMVLGIRGHTLLNKLLVGSTTDRIIRDSPCPVLAVRQVE